MKAKYYYISISIKRVEAFKCTGRIVLHSQSRSEYGCRSGSGDETTA